MTHRWNRTDGQVRSLYCAVVEVPAMSDPYDPRPQRGFRDLVPWADPYIAALIEKLRRSAESELCDNEPLGELPPPLDSDDARDGDGLSTDWTPRNWPRG
jgi:hypothetical protein